MNDRYERKTKEKESAEGERHKRKRKRESSESNKEKVASAAGDERKKTTGQVFIQNPQPQTKKIITKDCRDILNISLMFLFCFIFVFIIKIKQQITNCL